MPRIIGIDPGSRKTGYGVIEGTWGNLKCVDYGVLRLDTTRTTTPDDVAALLGDDPSQSITSLTSRMCELYERISEVIRANQCDSAALERVFMAKNADSALKLGHARGVLLLAVGNAGLPVYEYSPAQIKKCVAGSGRAEKAQMMSIVPAILGLDRKPAEDAADALAIAMCHAMLDGERALYLDSIR
ncbi:MAG TPA: crossover junction endodeoxyribonuclease RuvC [Myxococcota bacterium]|nr:crossover junction endodeoxyribonuclease RuvC [Myxococcota bacterium]HOD08258.1 crossover junction endodeoxyribonuclease RuvC [Myxococcota bacterium]HPB50639.1 crossover junction endodeoxyribonuclease RuvC [Myxococcota bacterium]HQP95260.1 crossover junction endodeoxyribonuclease RuvC [Myxococcota bacterium]